MSVFIHSNVGLMFLLLKQRMRRLVVRPASATEEDQKAGAALWQAMISDTRCDVPTLEAVKARLAAQGISNSAALAPKEDRAS